MRKILGFTELAFTVVSLLIYSGGVLYVILSGGASEGELGGGSATPSAFPLFLLIYLVTFLLLVVRWKKVLYVLSKDRLIWGLMGLVIVSIFWSFAPYWTMRGFITLFGSSQFGLYFATRYSLKQQMQMLAWTFSLAIVLSLMFAVALPKYGIMGGVHAGKFRGIYTHKNTLGKMMVLSSINFLLLATSDKKNRLFLWCGFSFSIMLLLLSTSSSSLINLATLIGAFLIFRIFRWRYELMIPALLVLVIVGGSFYIWFTANPEAVFSAVGKDATLTGRTDLWPLVLDMIEKHPWLGYGYSAFWLGLDGESAYVWNATAWNPPNSHNGILDLWLDLGISGVLIFLIGFGASLLKALALLRLNRTSDGLWPLIFFINLVLVNLTESTLMRPDDIFWLLYVAVVLSVQIPHEQQTQLLYKYRTNSHLAN